MGKALIVVDVQKDFCEGGALAVEGGNEVAKAIQDYIFAYQDEYDEVVFTKDWHKAPPSNNGGHFALNGEPDFVDTWPVHCVQGTEGAEFHPAIHTVFTEGYSLRHLFKKGDGKPDYSGFQGFNNMPEFLDEYLTDEGITSVDICGIAGDYCVRQTALDAVANGYHVVILDLLVASVGGDDATEGLLQEVQEAQLTAE